MQFLDFKTSFDAYIGVKDASNTHEKELFERAKKYISKITWISGIEMIAVVNSLSMYATHQDSDIDLFIITRKNRLWFVRVLVTCIFSYFGVWRKGEDIAGNFCLSFFITEDAINLENIAIDDDIYLYYWIYYLKPIWVRGDIYDRFLDANNWVKLDDTQKEVNQKFRIKNRESESGESKIVDRLYDILECVLRYFGVRKARKSAAKLENPAGVTIDKNILKFHNEDRRREIRDAIL